MIIIGSRARSFVAPILGGAGITTVLALLAARIEPLVDAAWFGLNTEVYFGSGATPWVSLAFASGICYLALLAIRTTGQSSTRHRAAHWARSYLAYSALFYTLVAAPCVMLVEATDESASWRSMLTFLVLEILLIAALSALLWVLAFHVPDYARAAWQIFLLGSVVLAVCQIVLDPGILDLVGSLLGIGDTFDVVTPYVLPGSLAYLAPVTPLVWFAWRRSRDTSPAHPGEHPSERDLPA